MQTQAITSFLPLRCFPKFCDKPQATKTSGVWAKVLDLLSDKELNAVSETSFLLRAIVWMKRFQRFQYIASFSPLKEQGESEWKAMKQASDQLPSFRLLKNTGAAGRDGILVNKALYQAIQLVSFEEFNSAFTSYFEMLKQNLCQKEDWLGAPWSEITASSNQSFLPYAEKLIVEPEMRRIFRGDMHGDLPSLLSFLNELQKNGDLGEDFRLLKPLKLMFLGDYVDRGVWGLEVIYLLLKLKTLNPESVFLVRGNHEDAEMADRLGFYQEYVAKFGKEDPESNGYKKLTAFYNSLPVVLYLGTKSEGPIYFIQCCHGGIEWGYNPYELLNAEGKRFERINEFKRLTECSLLFKHQVEVHSKGEKYLKPLTELCQDFEPITPKKPVPIGFMWSEFNVGPEDKTSYFEERGVFSCSKDLTSAAFSAASIGQNTLSAAIRAHQHAPNNPLMKLLLKTKGCVKLWETDDLKELALKQNNVFTLLLTPDSDSGLHVGHEVPFTYDTTLEMVGGPRLEDYELKVTNNEIYHQMG